MVAVLVGILGVLAGTVRAQSTLTAKDYDDFYSNVILKAQNGNKAEWLASYDPVVNFVARVRQDVEALPEATRRAFAQAVHDNGYWPGQQRRIRDRSDPFVGAKFKAGEDTLKAVLTAKGFDAYRNRYAQGAGGYRLALEDVADRAALYKLEGKNIPRLEDVPGNTSILNANAQSWSDLQADAQHFPNPAERLAVITRNQLNGIAAALALLRSSKPRSDVEMDYATAVIWRYTGHYNGRDGWEREPLVRTPYAQMSEAEKVKDRGIWLAVRDVIKAR